MVLVLIETGRSPAPSRVASMIWRASSRSRNRDTPLPLPAIFFAGQPILISMPAAPSWRAILAAARNCSGSRPPSWMMTGCSLGSS